MADVTRRGFLAQTAIATGVGVAGALGLHQFVLPRMQADGSIGTTNAATTTTGAAMATTSTGMPATGAAVGGAPSLDSLSLGGLAGPMIVHVRDLSTAEISVMVGSQEFVYRDPELVARLVKTAGSAMAEG
jgi:hypothetical protein